MAQLEPLKPEKPKKSLFESNEKLAAFQKKRAHKQREDARERAAKGGKGGATRREFIVGGAGVGAAAVVVGVVLGTKGCSGNKEESSIFGTDDENFEALKPNASQVDNVIDFGEQDPVNCCIQTLSLDLPINTIVYAGSSSYATMLVPTDSARTSLMSVHRLNMLSGYEAVTLAEAVSFSEGYEIYDVRGSDTMMIWSEVNFLTRAWRVYCAQVSGQDMGEYRLIEEGDEVYDPPMLCVCDDMAVWTVMPNASGSAKGEDSYVKGLRISDSEATTIYTSHGRLCCNPQSSGSILTIAPRVDTTNVYYRLLAIDTATNKTISSVVLPKSVAASEAIYMNGHFTFCIEQTYDYGEEIGVYGTYLVNDDGSIMLFNRTPTTAPAWCGDWMMVKSTQSVVGINPDLRHYFAIKPPDDCANYGDFLATAGSCDRFVVYTTISDGTGSGNGVTRVRVFETIADTAEKTPPGEGYSLDEVTPDVDESASKEDEEYDPWATDEDENAEDGDTEEA